MTKILNKKSNSKYYCNICNKLILKQHAHAHLEGHVGEIKRERDILIQLIDTEIKFEHKNSRCFIKTKIIPKDWRVFLEVMCNKNFESGLSTRLNLEDENVKSEQTLKVSE